MNKSLLPLILVFIFAACSPVNNQDNRQNNININMAQTFMDDLFVRADLEAVKAAMNSEFTFTYIGNIERWAVLIME